MTARPANQGKGMRPDGAKRRVPPLSLKQTAPTDWHHDPPAFPGDPYMDWENSPEPPPDRLAEPTPRPPLNR
jgi:hypothetical protein